MASRQYGRHHLLQLRLLQGRGHLSRAVRLCAAPPRLERGGDAGCLLTVRECPGNGGRHGRILLGAAAHHRDDRVHSYQLRVSCASDAS